jgi:hypothetical protein
MINKAMSRVSKPGTTTRPKSTGPAPKKVINRQVSITTTKRLTTSELLKLKEKQNIMLSKKGRNNKYPK